jgi:hypothetical protein
VHLASSAPWTLGSQTELSGVHAPATTSHTVNTLMSTLLQ